MPDLWMDVDIAIASAPVNILPLIDDTDFKTIKASVAYNAGGMALKWNFTTTAGVTTQTAVTPTTSGNYDWTNLGNGMYALEITSTGGASINNDTEGVGWFSGVATGVLPWRGPTIGFRAAALNNSLIDAGTTGLLAPGTAARTLTVTATGAASVNWGDVENKTTTNALTGTTIATTQKVDIETIKTNPVVNAGTVTFPTTATLASTTNITAGTVTTATNVTTVNGLAANVITATSINADAITAAKVADGTIDAATFATDAISSAAVSAAAVTKIQAGLATPTNITAGTITTVTNLTNAATAGDFTATMKTSIGTAVAASAVASVTGNVGGNVNGNVVGTVGSVVGNVGGNVVGTVASVVGAVGSVTGNVGGNVVGTVASVVGAVGSVTGNVGGNVTGTIGGLTIAAVKDFFDTDSGTTYGAAVAGSVVKEIADNSGDAGDGSGLTAIPWNAAWDTEVQSEVTDALQAPVSGTVPSVGSLPSLEQAAFMSAQYDQNRAVTGTLSTVTAPDTTTLYELTLDDAINPTSTVRTG